jgi:xanthine/uracil/vitamin C permease (AzgA family)
MLEKLFALKAQGVTPRSEIVAGTTVFFTMAYILFVNPKILAAAGMDPGAVFIATLTGLRLPRSRRKPSKIQPAQANRQIESQPQ